MWWPEIENTFEEVLGNYFAAEIVNTFEQGNYFAAETKPMNGFHTLSQPLSKPFLMKVTFLLFFSLKVIDSCIKDKIGGKMKGNDLVLNQSTGHCP